MNLITQYGVHGLMLVLGVRVDFILQNVSPPGTPLYVHGTL